MALDGARGSGWRRRRLLLLPLAWLRCPAVARRTRRHGPRAGHRRAHGQPSGAAAAAPLGESRRLRRGAPSATSPTVPAPARPPAPPAPATDSSRCVDADPRRQRRHPDHRAATRVHRDDRRETGQRAAHPIAPRAARARRLRAAIQFLLRYDRREAGRDAGDHPAALRHRHTRSATPQGVVAASAAEPLRARRGIQRRRLLLRRAAQAGQPAVRAAARRCRPRRRDRRCSGSKSRPKAGRSTCSGFVRPTIPPSSAPCATSSGP